MTRYSGLILALALAAAGASADPEFQQDKATVQALDWQYTQILTYNYTNGNTGISDVDNGERTASRDIQRDGWIAFFLYDYTAGRYTEQLLVGHNRL